MKRMLLAAVVSALFCVPAPGATQEVAPFFTQVPAVMFETYQGVNQPAFTDYFASLVEKYQHTGGTSWSIYNENAKTAHRVTALPEGLPSMLPIQEARVKSSQEFTDAQRVLFNSAWATRHLAIYNAMPDMSYVPADFSTTVDLPFVRTRVHHLKWDQQGAFRAALARRGELDREAGIDNLVLVAWNGGIGTEAPVVMLTVFAESQEADVAALAERNRIRQGYWAEWAEQNRIMNDASVSIDESTNRFNAALSYSSGR
jgi:hypothetical protein